MTASPRAVCASHLSTLPNAHEAVDEATGAIAAALGPRAPTLVAMFASTHHARFLDRLPALVADKLGCDRLIGCTGEGIIGTGREVEEEPALSLWAAHLPRLAAHPFHLSFEPRVDLDKGVHGWPEPIDTGGRAPRVLVFLDPFSSVPQLVLDQFAKHYPGATVSGGVASGGLRPGKNRLFLGREAMPAGAVGLLLHGPERFEATVSQGSKPIGRPFVVTKVQQNVVLELAGQSAFERFQQMYATLAQGDQKLARHSLHLGCVIDERKQTFARGDFLLRNIHGIDPNTGAIMVSEPLRLGQTVQFHVRDAATASEDLALCVDEAVARARGDLAGALLFSCNGRGTRLFDKPDHDARVLSERAGNLPVAGFFAQGEIGPVGGRSYLHGFTASLLLVYRSVEDESA